LRNDHINVSVYARDGGDERAPTAPIEAAAVATARKHARPRTLSATGERYARLLAGFIALVCGLASGFAGAAIVIFGLKNSNPSAIEIGLFAGVLVGMLPGIFLARYVDTRLFGYNASA
jgi:hypothetical protein